MKLTPDFNSLPQCGKKNATHPKIFNVCHRTFQEPSISIFNIYKNEWNRALTKECFYSIDPRKTSPFCLIFLLFLISDCLLYYIWVTRNRRVPVPSLRDLLIHICRPLVKPIIIAGTDDYIVDVVDHSFLTDVIMI